MEKPLVSVITVNYNQSGVTRDFLNSMRSITYPSVEIFVVDNGSPNDNPDTLAEEFPEIKLIKTEKNLGFAGGNNLALEPAEGEYCLFINNDTEVEPDFLEPLVLRFQEDPSLGMVSPKIKFFHTPETIQYAGYYPYNWITIRQHLIGYREKDRGQYDEGGYTFGAHGAAMMIPRKVIQEIGPMAELFFLYYEEHDWCERIKRAGYQVYYEPRSVVWHKESVSTGRASPLKLYYLTRNRILFARRNNRGITKLISLVYLFTVVPAKFTVLFLIQRRFTMLRKAYQATAWNILNKKYE